MINFTTTYSHEFWKGTQSELLSFFEEMEDLEYWTVKDEDIYPFLIFFEIQLNNITNLSDLLGKEHQFNSLIENLSYLKLGTFFYWVHAVNKEQPAFIFSCLLHCREEKNIFEKLFIERFKLLERYNFLSKIIEENRLKLFRTILAE